MAEIVGKISEVLVDRALPRFRLTLTNREPSDVQAIWFWVSRTPGTIPESPNYDAILAVALWASTNGVKVRIRADSLDQKDVALDSLIALG